MSTGFGRNRWSAAVFKNTLQTGTTLQGGKYTLIEVYGQGPFSITYLARQNVFGRQVVINELFLIDHSIHAPGHEVVNEGIDDKSFAEFKARWFEVPVLLSKCSRNENFIPVLDAFEENNTVYYVTDYIGEADLRTFTLDHKDKRLGENQAIGLVRQIAGGLSFLHENNIFHLNLSPVKVLIEKGHRPIIFSVGIARNFISPEIVPDISILARPGYTAPELYSREPENGRLADIYSLGAILYYLLTGKDPVAAPERKDKPLVEPRKLVPAVSSAVSTAIMKAMSMDPAGRYQTVEEFMHDLERDRISLAGRNVKRALTYASAGVLLAALITTGIIAYRNFGETPGEKAATVAEQRRLNRQEQLSQLTLNEDQTRGISIVRDAAAKDSAVLGKNYALLIGIENYRDSRYQKLTQPVHDAMALNEILVGNYTFEKQNVSLLADPDKREIFKALNFYRDSLSPNDNLFVFYAGHGRYDKKSDMGYIIPVNGDYTNDADWISFQEMREKFEIIPAKHILLVADACFAGSVFRGEEADEGEGMSTMVFDQINKRSRTAFTSAYLQPVPDRSEFLRHLISTLKNNRERFFLSEDLYINTRNSLMKSTSKTDPVKYGVIRDCGDEGGDFIFVRRDQ